jgi:D-aspartate ligase
LKNNKTGIIVLGGHVQALGIVRAFGRIGLRVIVIDNTRKNISRHSKYCFESYNVPEKSLKDFLVSLGEKGEYAGWIIFPTNDFHVKILSLNKTELEKYFIVSTDHWKSVSIFYNKKETYNLAEKLNIPFAQTFYPADEEDLKKNTPKYPCIIKPAIMHDFFSQTKKKVLVCHNFDELIKKYTFAKQFIPADQIIIQNIIPGSSRNQFSACFLFLNGKTYVSLVANRLRQHPIDFGNASTYVETVDLPQLVEYSERILKAAGYNGLCEVEFKKDEADGVCKLLEINPRTWKWHSIAEQTQTPFLETIYNYLTGNEISVSESPRFASFRHFLTDFPVQLKMFLKGHQSPFRIKKPVVNAVWDKDDPKPWFYEKFYIVHLLKDR